MIGTEDMLGTHSNTLGEPLRWPPASVLLRQHSDGLKTSESQRSATNARGQRSGSLSIFGGMCRKQTIERDWQDARVPRGGRVHNPTGPDKNPACTVWIGY